MKKKLIKDLNTYKDTSKYSETRNKSSLSQEKEPPTSSREKLLSQYLFHLNSCYDYKLPAVKRKKLLAASKSSNSLFNMENRFQEFSNNSFDSRTIQKQKSASNDQSDTDMLRLSNKMSHASTEKKPRNALIPIKESSIAQREDGPSLMKDPAEVDYQAAQHTEGVLFTQPKLPRVKVVPKHPKKPEPPKRKRNFEASKLKTLVARENIDNVYYDAYLIRNITMQKVVVRDQLITLSHKFFHLKVQFLDENLLAAVQSVNSSLKEA